MCLMAEPWGQSGAGQEVFLEEVKCNQTSGTVNCIICRNRLERRNCVCLVERDVLSWAATPATLH